MSPACQPRCSTPFGPLPVEIEPPRYVKMFRALADGSVFLVDGETPLSPASALLKASASVKPFNESAVSEPEPVTGWARKWAVGGGDCPWAAIAGMEGR